MFNRKLELRIAELESRLVRVFDLIDQLIGDENTLRKMIEDSDHTNDLCAVHRKADYALYQAERTATSLDKIRMALNLHPQPISPAEHGDDIE